MYFVLSSAILLFSPQVCISENSDASCLHLDLVGIFLMLTCGTQLSFPLHNNSDLPIMLTQKAIHPSPTYTTQQVCVPSINSFCNTLSFVTTSTFISFTQINNIQMPHESVLACPINQANFCKSNWNLDSAQQELVIWHYRLGYTGIETVQCLLPKPHSNTSLVPYTQIRIIVPQNNKSSYCNAPICASCQLGKQKHSTPLLVAKIVPTFDGGVSEQKNITPG